MRDVALRRKSKKPAKAARGTAAGHCLCGAVAIEIDLPAFWAWHDHGAASRRAHGAAYATYVGCWKSKVRVTKGAKSMARYEDKSNRTVRSFCGKCGTPLFYERPSGPRMVNIPRALFDTRTGREPRYHLNLADSPEWAYRQEPLAPLKGYPGVLIERPRKKRKPLSDELRFLEE